MDKLHSVKDIYCGNEGDIYLADNGVMVWDVTIDADIGEEVRIAHISDIHFNYCNSIDFEENDPVLMSTYKNRVWCENGSTVRQFRNILELTGDAHQIVINGDTLDYISHGTMELMDREVWEKIPDVIATVGGHEICINMQGEVPETKTYEERVAIIKDYWRHDIYYVSKVLCDKVMVVSLFNNLAAFNEYQLEKLTADLETAKENGYTVMIFAHEPFRTCNPDEKNFSVDRVLVEGDTKKFPMDFCDCTTRLMVGADSCDDTTKAVYNLIINNADVVKAIFVGHFHNNIYTEILAKTSSGENGVIPQYIHTASAYDDGSFMRICIK